MPATRPQGFAELEFDLPSALLKSVISHLDGIDAVELNAANTLALPDAQGVYLLFHNGQPVYVGKTDGKAGLRRRLARHSRRILHRNGLDPSSVYFKALRVYVFTAVDIETDLIEHYQASGGLLWNGGGFGSNDPGRERDTSRNKPTNFFALYPIDIDRQIDFRLPATTTAADALAQIRAKLPYGFRFETVGGRSRTPHADLTSTTVTCTTGAMTAREAISLVVRQLPSGWQATKLLGYVILYNERRSYAEGSVIASS